MDSQSKVYSRRQLIAVAEVANALAHAKDIAGLEAVPELAEAAFSERLCPDLYPPHQQWQNGGDSSRIGQPASNSKQVWRSLAAKCIERHISDKDDFNYPPAASTYHLLADDVFAFACSGGLGTYASTALKELAVRYKKELAIEPTATANPAPAQSPATPAPVETVAVATVDQAKPKRSVKRRSWRDVSETYLENTYKELQCPPVKEFYRALLSKAEVKTGSPFDKGTVQNQGSLFARDVYEKVTFKMIEGFVTELRKKM